MNIVQLEYDTNDPGKVFFDQELTGDSDAIDISDYRDKLTIIVISNVAGGSATIEYSLSSKSKVLEDTAIFHASSMANISTSKQGEISVPVNYLKVVTNPTLSSVPVTYQLEILV